MQGDHPTRAPRPAAVDRPLVVTVVALAAFAAAFVIAGALGWWAPADNEQAIGEVSRWCERVRGGLLREPVNTLGNLGFVVAGLAMLFVLRRDARSGAPQVNRFIGHTRLALLYAAAAVFLGPGSMVMHGSHTFFGAWIDNVSMVAYILIPWLFNLSLRGGWSQRALFTAYGSLLGAYAVGYWVFGSDLGIGLDLFGLSIGLWIISEFLYRFDAPWARPVSGLVGFVVAVAFGITPAEMIDAPGEYWWVVLFWVPALLVHTKSPGRRRYTPWFWVGMGSFLLAYAIWLTGTGDDAGCNPDSIIQAHAIWHLLSAVATFGFFLFLRTERSRESVSSTD